ncbi:LmeA family phospholipid-binding protein [Rhodococcus spelaei]|uniref:LmeA family phospholipid-binding protein n=1 Tax=Rhodococcus spelaei TaxID=2546320 RepID=UPI0015EE3B3D|nr:LmeA family phospholipid-binding protein [Rhodococcus spelaei]
MRKLILALACLLALVVVVDFGAAAYSEYRVSRSLREGGALTSDPEVTVTGFPFLTQAAAGTYKHVEIRARGVDSTVVGDVTVEANLHGAHVPASELVNGSVRTIPVDHLDGRVLIEATNLGKFLGIPDLEVSAPPADKSDGTGGSGGSGMTTAGGIVLTGTVPVGPLKATVSVQANLVLDGDNVKIVATNLYFGPEGHADFTVPAVLEPTVLGLFTKNIDAQQLPFGLRPTKVYAQGSQVVIEGSGDNVVINLDEMVRS